MGGNAWNNIRTLRRKGTIYTGGLPGNFTSLQDLEAGRSVSHIKLGELTMSEGFDGKMGWHGAYNGEVSPEDSAAEKQADATAAYQAAWAWWFPKRWAARIKMLGAHKEGGKTYQVLRITPQGGVPFELWIDARTHFIARTVEPTSVVSAEETTYLSDYRSVSGVKLPFRELQSNGLKRYNSVQQTTSVAVNLPVSDGTFSMPQEKLADFSIAGGATEATIPFELVNSHVYIPVRVDAHPFEFMLDSGGANVMTSATLESAGIQSKGALEGRGAGKERVNLGFGKVRNLTLGGKVTLDNQWFAVLPKHGFSEAAGRRFDGLVEHSHLI